MIENSLPRRSGLPEGVLFQLNSQSSSAMGVVISLQSMYSHEINGQDAVVENSKTALVKTRGKLAGNVDIFS